MDSADSPVGPEAGYLMESLLASLLDDFDHWFHRGQELLERCPDDVLEGEEREALRGRLDQGLKAVAATRALTRAASQPVAVSMEAMTPWHGLVTEVWGLAARLGQRKA